MVGYSSDLRLFLFCFCCCCFCCCSFLPDYDKRFIIYFLCLSVAFDKYLLTLGLGEMFSTV